MIRGLVFIAVFIATAGAAQAQLYRWTDDKGRVHVTDTPPPPGAKNVQQRKPSAASSGEGQQLPFELTLAMKEYPVTLYTSPICKDACALAREYLNKRGVPFKEIQVWDFDSNEELKRVSGGTEVPTLMVGSSVKRGFNQDSYKELLDSARYPNEGSVAARNQPAPPLPDAYKPQAERESQKAQPAKPEESKPRGPYSPK